MLDVEHTNGGNDAIGSCWFLISSARLSHSEE